MYILKAYDISESLALFSGLRYDLGERSAGIPLGLEGGELTNVNMDEVSSYSTIVSNAERKSSSYQPTRLGEKVETI
jgi:hypothetical protein